jgi:hypothetical protein
MDHTPQAFLSYTRLDDEGHQGGITALRTALELQVRIVTGDDSFVIFQDVDGIAFGEHWPKRLNEALAASRFLIPVLSPRFLRSEPCRDELRKFLAYEQAAGRDDLILPIYWVETKVLELPHLTAADELAAAIAERQRWDWRGNAIASPTTQTVRKAIRKLAEAIAERLERELLPQLPRTQAPVPPRRRRPARQPGEVFRDVDASWCREMVVIPTGSFTMGSPEAEKGRGDDEGPQREVTLARPFALGRYPVTRGGIEAFLSATHHAMSSDQPLWVRREWGPDPDWRYPRFDQTNRHPAVYVIPAR